MRKVLVGALAGLTLIAGQAVAAGASQPVTVGDRVGAAAGETRGYGMIFENTPVVLEVLVFVGLGWGAIELFDNDDSRSG